jgi:hypothetical protein
MRGNTLGPVVLIAVSSPLPYNGAKKWEECYEYCKKFSWEQCFHLFVPI